MQLIHLTDTHLAPVGTRYRVDNFEDAIFSKLEYTARIAEEAGIEYIIHTGDVFDLQNPRGVPRELIYRFGEFLMQHRLRWVLIAGQHDYRGRDPSSGKASPLALFKWHPRVHHVAVNERVSQVRLGDEVLWCVPYSPDVCSTLASLEVDDQIVAVHAMVTDTVVAWEHIMLGEVAECGAKIVMSGDYHKGFDPQQVVSMSSLLSGEGHTTLFSNPGAIARMNIVDAERPIKVALIDTEGPTVEYVDVPYSTTAFDLSAAAVAKEERVARVSFVNRLSKLSLSTELTWDTLQVIIGDEDKEVVEKARYYFESVSA